MARYKFTTIASGTKSVITQDHETIEDAILEIGKQPMEGWVELLDHRKQKTCWSKLPTDYLFESWKTAKIQTNVQSIENPSYYTHAGRMIKYKATRVFVHFRYIYSNGSESNWHDCNEFSNEAELLEAYPDIKRI